MLRTLHGNVAKKLSKLEVKSTTIRGNFSTFSSRICNTEKSWKNVFWKTSHDYFSQYWPLHCKLTSLPYKSERKIEFGGQLRSGIANTDLNSLDHISRKSREQTLRCDVTAHEVPMHTLLKNFHKKRQAMSFLGKSIIHFESAFSRIQILSLDTVSTLIKRHSIREARKKEIMLK